MNNLFRFRGLLTTLGAVTFTALVFGCAPTETPEATVETVDTAAEANAIMALEREWSAKFVEQDVEWIMNLHTADAIQLPPGAGPAIGLEAIRAAWEGMANTEGLQLSWEPTTVHVAPSGDMAYDYGTATMIPPGGEAQAMKYLVVWTRVNGEWKVAADMFNANDPPAS